MTTWPCWQITFGSSPHQTDRSTCGGFAIATAVHLLFGRPIPASTYRATIQRRFLAFLVSPGAGTMAWALWPFTMAEDRAAVAVPEVKQSHLGHWCREGYAPFPRH